jgi:DNA-binding FadR family transcriptional regulator
MPPASTSTADAVRLDAATIEAIAQRVVELIGSGGREGGSDLIAAKEVADRFGVSRAWVYENAERLGVIRLGTGKRARLRFDSEVVRKRLESARDPRDRACSPAGPSRWLDEADLIPIRGL